MTDNPIVRPPRPRKKAAKVLKLIVTGAPRSGKTTFIRSISQYTEWQAEPEKSWFFGRVRVDETLILHFIEPPAQEQFDFIWLRDVIGRLQATGFILMLNSARPQSFAPFISILYTVRGFHAAMPMVVAANRQDHVRAWSCADIQMGLGLVDIAVLPCIAHNREMVRDVVLEVLYQAMER